MLASIVTVDVDCTSNTQQKLRTTAVRMIAALSAGWCDNGEHSLDVKRYLNALFDHDKPTVIAIMVW
jgi:hypothetical protein